MLTCFHSSSFVLTAFKCNIFVANRTGTVTRNINPGRFKLLSSDTQPQGRGGWEVYFNE